MSSDSPRLFLITPKISDAAAFAATLDAALKACDVACVLLRTEGRDLGENKKIVRALAPLAQDRDAALLVENDAQLAIRSGADGCHIESVGEPLAAALAALQPDRIVGAGRLTSRDDAMTAGEAGVDYLMFGGPDDAEPHEAILERVRWWAEIFNIPCVAYAHALTDVGELTEAGADFIALGEAVFEDPRGPAAALADVAATLAKTREKAQ
ncbi:Thiamine-phosphate synthase [Methylocella tundrae]|uniref:Thiamine-phosphate synthase n=1 Tax=Methylocella tundrae TaxID=227605 RepID=A0A8B6M993_METTU|nr:thiamine phosphate synthase [Methylocella tundrae]VTZ50614.1 Thiamine-phosphate synthase [Methylocella tundrae]